MIRKKKKLMKYSIPFIVGKKLKMIYHFYIAICVASSLIQPSIA